MSIQKLPSHSISKSHFSLLCELDMADFDIIHGMDLLHSCYDLIDSRNRVVQFMFSNKLVLKWKGSTSIPIGQFIFFLKAKKIFPNSVSVILIYLRIKILRSQLLIQYLWYMNFLEVFPEYLHEVPP